MCQTNVKTAARNTKNKIRQGRKPTGGNGKSSKKKGNVNSMTQSFKPRKKEVNINTNFSMFNKGRSGQDRGILIDKTEPVGVIESDGSGDFHICAKYAINPGQASTFPILSQEAKVYEKYMFEELEFFTIPLVSQYALGGQQGETALAINYNPALPSPASQTAALSLKPYDANLPCLPLQIRSTKPDLTQTTAMFVRTGNLPGNADVKTYDVGNLYVTCEGLYETPFNICRLFVRYKCRLFNRVVLTDQGPPQNMSCSYFNSNSDSQVLSASGAGSYLIFNNAVCNGLNVVGVGGSVLTVPFSGNYNVDYSVFLNRATSAGDTDDIHYVIADLTVNAGIQYPNIHQGGAYSVNSLTTFQGAMNYCLALKAGDLIRIIVVGIYGGASNNVRVGGTIRITAI